MAIDAAMDLTQKIADFRSSGASGRTLTIDSENAALAARSFRTAGTIVIVFQLLYIASDYTTIARDPQFYMPFYAGNAVDALFAIAVTHTRWFPRYWKPLALLQVGLLDVIAAFLNMVSGTVTPHFYNIITFSFGCAVFLPWGVIWQSALNLICLTTYVIVNLYGVDAQPFARQQWIALLAVLILSEFPAAFIDEYRRRLLKQLEELVSALKASRDKSEFLASMSHEIRTPLNTVIGMIEVLEGTSLTAEQSQFLGTCRSSGVALVGLINDIVDISRIEAGELQLGHVDFDLIEMLDQAADTLALRAHRKDLELIFSVRPGTPTRLTGDPLRLKQVCLNLLVNAIKFTEKGEVVVRVEADAEMRAPGALRFCVADTGAGIAPEEQEGIFSRFAQAPSSMSAGQQGSGLGLDISKRLIEAMGGRIWVESILGMGSTFYFTCQFDVQSTAQNEGLSTPSLRARVLVVDDNCASRAAIGEMLGNVGAAVSLCDGVARARQELHREQRSGLGFDVILLDARMSPDDGIALAKELEPSERDRTIVMFTRDDFPAGPRAAREAGLARHLMKPIKRAELLDAMTSVATKSQPAPRRLDADSRPYKVENLRGLTILLAEDSEDNRLLIAAYLRSTPHRLETAENGRIAVEMFKTRSYDLVLMDINMPVMDGLGAAAAIRAWEGEQGVNLTPIITVTGRASADDRRRSAEVGCNGHLVKPLPRQVLLEAIARFTQAG